MHISTKLTKAAMPNSASLLFLNFFKPIFKIKSIPPFSFIIAIVPAIIKEIIISSLIPIAPLAIDVHNPTILKLPEANPIIPAITIPAVKIIITFNPQSAAIITAK